MVAEKLRLVWVDPDAHFLCCLLEFAQHYP